LLLTVFVFGAEVPVAEVPDARQHVKPEKYKNIESQKCGW
jgi:hypothetical protein